MAEVSKEELAAIVQHAVRDALRDVGLYAADDESVQDARKDFMFVRSLRQRCEAWTNKVGGAVILFLLSGVLWLLGYGFKVFIGK